MFTINNRAQRLESSLRFMRETRLSEFSTVSFVRMAKPANYFRMIKRMGLIKAFRETPALYNRDKGGRFPRCAFCFAMVFLSPLMVLLSPLLLLWICTMLSVLLAPLVGVTALFYKMRSIGVLLHPEAVWSSADWILMAGLMNQIAALDRSAQSSEATVMHFLFAGEDGELQEGETQAKGHFERAVLRAFVDKYAWIRGIALFEALDSTDWQKLVVSESVTH